MYTSFVISTLKDTYYMMCYLKWPLMISVLLQLFSHGQTTNENETISTRKELQHSENSNEEMNRYTILQSDPIIAIHNVTQFESYQSTSAPEPFPTDMVDFSVVLSPQSEERIDLSSLLEPNDGFKYTSVSSPNKTPDIASTSISNKEHSSNIGNHPLSNKKVVKFDSIEPASSFSSRSSSDSSEKIYASQSGIEISLTTLPLSWTTTPLISDSETSTLQNDYVQKTSNLKREETVSQPPLNTNLPATQTITVVQHVSAANSNQEISSSYRIPHTQIIQTTSDSSQPLTEINTSPFLVDTTVPFSQAQNGTQYSESEGIQYSVESKARSLQHLHNFTASDSESDIRNEALLTSNGIHHPSISETVISPLPTSSIPNKNLDLVVKSQTFKPPSGEGIISLPTYHPNDVIHISSSELYPSDAIHNMSHEEKHPCVRPCKEGSPPMKCRYKFELEWYYTMSKACHNCALNLEDCDRKDCVVADGVRRPIVVVNRQLPGPSIEVCKGDHIIVDMENHMMEESTTIHWHGHHQRGTPYMDGVPYVTQCPIPPKSSFRYHYVADTPGTHFWHSHSGCQRADGVFGALIVRVPSSRDPHRDLYNQDLSEHIVQILDWDHKLGVDKFLAHHHANGDNKPETLLVNGRGRFHQFQDVDSITRNVTHSPTTIFTVQQGFRYRFRLINAGFLNCPIEMSVDNHTLLVISSDGTDLKPVEADSLVSYAGERFDFVLKANKKIGNYWMKFRGLMDCDERFKKAHQVAVLHYDGAPVRVEPPGEVSYEAARREGLHVNTLNVGRSTAGSLVIPELDAIAEDDESLKEEPDMTFYLSYDFYDIDNPDYHRLPFYGFDQVHSKFQLKTPQLNHISLKLPPFPLLSQHSDIDKKYPFCNETTVSGCESKYCECTHVIEVPLGSVLELILVDKGKAFNANHPFHLHGHAFRVIAMEKINSSTTVEEVKAMDKAGLIHRKLKGAPIKDTITVPDGGFTIVRVHASNPGYWLFHCHIEFHVELGMAVVFKVGQHKDFPSTPPGFPRCNNYMPSEEEIEEINSDSINNDIVVDGTHWWPLKSNSNSGSSKIFVLPDLALLLLLCAAVR